MYEIIESLIQRVNVLEEQVKQLQKSSVQKHYNPWPDSLPYQPWSPSPYQPNIWPTTPIIDEKTKKAWEEALARITKLKESE